jgi:hypothetical protein
MQATATATTTATTTTTTTIPREQVAATAAVTAI